mgnify:CR=1 FL=1
MSTRYPILLVAPPGVLPGPVGPLVAQGYVPDGVDGTSAPTVVGVSTRMLIILALLCGLALIIAFAVQASQIV